MTTPMFTENDVRTTNGHAKHSVNPTAIIRLLPSVEDHWALVGALVTRMQAFIKRFHLEPDPVVVTKHLTSFWAAGAETVAFWVALDGNRVCGHAVDIIEHFWGAPYGMVMQAEVDHPYVMTLQQRHEMKSEMAAWARAQGATSLKMLTPRDPDAFILYSGFVFDKTLLKMPLGAEE